MNLKRYAALPFMGVVAFGLSLVVAAAPAQAQATRTWVSGVGDDVNPCSRTAPCKTFAGAISKTAAGGEINCLDPGGFGTLTITKSIIVDCTGTIGSALNSGGINGFVINASATASPGTIEVRLRNLSINGAGSTPGLNGVRFIRGASLSLEGVYIQNQSNSGVNIAPSSGTATVNISNTVIDNTGSGMGGGILVVPTGNGFARVTMRDVQVLGSGGNALRMDSTQTSGLGILATIENSAFASSGAGGISVNAGNSGPFNVTLLADSTVFNNATTGIGTTGSQARVRVRNTDISLNGTGVSPGTGFINDLGGNTNIGNTIEGGFN